MNDDDADDEWLANAVGVGEEIPDDDVESFSLGHVDTKIEELRPHNISKGRTFSVTYNNFEELPCRIAPLPSPNFSCFGHEWRIELFPNGNGSIRVPSPNESGTRRPKRHKQPVAIFLVRVSEGKQTNIKYSIAIKSGDMKIISHRDDAEFGDDYIDSRWGESWFPCFRSDITERYLRRGALTIHVKMQIGEYIPKNPASSMMLNLFGNEDFSDVVFEVSEQQIISNNEDVDASKSSVQFHAHRLILQNHSPELAALCATSEGMTPIIIDDVKSEVFRLLLYYVYGGDISEEEFVANTEGLIKAADKYGVVNLKLEAEVWYVNDATISIDNVIDLLQYAGAMNCALLKEAVMDFIVDNKEEVIKHLSFQDVPGDMYKDLLAAMTRHYETESGEDSDDDEDDVDGDEEGGEKGKLVFSRLRIRDLRQKLDEKGLDVDGSRDTLIAALMEHS